MHPFTKYTRLLAASALVLAPTLAMTQPTAPTAAAARPAARAEDVRSIEAIMGAIYDAISGSAGQERDWDRFRSLFLPGARLIPTGRRASDSVGVARVWDVEEYIRVAGPGLKGGFFEREIGSRTDRYGSVVQRFSAYESRRALDDAKPFARGVNSFQLFNDGKRWWVVTIYWEGESPSNPIPAEYLRTSP